MWFSRLILSGLLIGAVAFGALSLVVPAGAQDDGGGVGETPTSPSADGTSTSQASLSRAIDAAIAKIYERDGITPAGLSDDEEFIRRVFLDTVGAPPSPDEVTAFLDDDAGDKREQLIARLVDDDRFGRHMADLWGNIIIGRTGRDYGGANHLFAVWLAGRINGDAPFRDIIVEIVSAEGALADNPAVAVYTREVPFAIANTAGNLSRTLTGVQIQCAECHDHPYGEAWTEETFNGVASFFSPVRVRVNNRVRPVNPDVRDIARMPRIPQRRMERLPERAKERIRLAQRFNRPVTLDGTAVKSRDRSEWRPALARWMVSDENTQTARYVANRFWSFAFGIGLLNPVDDFNSFNVASHPGLLDELGRELIDSGYDVKRLYRAILNSRTYQLSSREPPENAEAWHFASAPVRRLTPEQFFGSIVEVAGGKDLARTLRTRNGSVSDQLKRRYNVMKRRMKRADDGNMREINFDDEALEKFIKQLEAMPDVWFLRRHMAQQLASLSSDDEMNESEGFTLSMDQALFVLNGEITNRLSGSTRGTPLFRLLREHETTQARVEQLYLRVLARRPSKAEHAAMAEYVEGCESEAQAFEDIMFALLAGTEFATNH